MKQLLLIISVLIHTSLVAQRTTLVVPSGHSKQIDKVAVSPNGKYVASISHKTIIIWELISNKKIHEINLNISRTSIEIKSVSITNNLDNLVVLTNDGLYSYNIQTGKQLFRDGGVSSGGATISKDGTELYVVNYGRFYIYDATSGQIKKRIDNFANSSANNCKFYELDGNRLLVLYSSGWSMINIASGDIELKKEFSNIYSENLSVYDYSPADNLIIGLRDEEYLVYDALTANKIKSKTSQGIPKGVCAIGDKQIVAFSYDYKNKNYKMEVMQLPALNVIKTVIQPDTEVPESIFYGTHTVQIPKTKKVVFNNNNELYVLDASDAIYERKFDNRISDFKPFYYCKNLSQRLSADNSLRLSTEDNGIRQINFENYKPEGYVQAMKNIVLSTDGKIMASIDQKITILDGTTGKIIKTIALPTTVDPSVEFFFFNYNNAKLIYTNGQKGTLYTIDIATGASAPLVTMGELLMSESASFDGKYFAAITAKNDQNYLTVYNFESKSIVLNKHLCDPYKDADCPNEISFLNDSYYIIATGQKENVRIFKADDVNYLSSFSIKHYNKFSILGGDIKNNIIAIGEVGQFQVGAHNLKLITKEGKLIREFKAEGNNDFLKAAFSKDDKVMFAPTTQKGIQVWNTETGELLGTYYFVEKTKEYIFISPEGLFEGSVEGMKELYFVINNKPIPLDKLYEKYYTPELLRRKINGEKFTPPDIDKLHNAPNVKIKYEENTRATDRRENILSYTNTSGIAEITVIATSPEDQIDEIRLFHNGKAVNLSTRGLFVTDNDGTDSKKYTINLLPGNNSFRAIALNSQRTESEPDEIMVVYTKDGVVPPPVNPDNKNTVVVDKIDRNATLYIVVVGINTYKEKISPLTYAVPDATAFKAELEKDANSIIGNVKSFLITDDNASKSGIMLAFDNIKKTAKPEDIFVFYYAGHGYIHPSNKEFYLVSSDVIDGGESLLKNGVSAKELQNLAVNIPAQKQLFIMDACQSAGAFEKMLQHDGEQQKNLALIARSTGTHWMAASGSTETAKEYDELGHGVFTYSLLEGLKGKAISNKMITVNGLKEYLQSIVPDLVRKYGGNSQYPASYGFGNDFPVEKIK